MWKRMLALVPVLATVGSTARTTEAAAKWPEGWPDVVKRLERGAFNEEDLLAARAACLQGLQAAELPRETEFAFRYSAAYANWRLVRVPNAKREEQIPLHDEAAAHIRKALELDSKSAEAWGLLSAIYGSQMGFVPAMGLELGNHAAEAIQQAVKLAPDNPRVVLFQGTSAFHTPPSYGGSVEAAEKHLRRAIQLFDSEPPERPWPNWGRLDAHLWLGILLEKRGDREGARAEYKKTLSIDPEFGWARYVLLPRLDAQEAKSK